MNTTRRNLLKASLAAGTVAMAAGAGLLSPHTVLAAWPEKAFQAKQMDEALSAIVGGGNLADSSEIKVEAPDIAENGAVVSVSVTTTLANVESMTLFVPANAFPLSSSYLMSSKIDGKITGRIKMAKTSDVVAVVKAGGKLYTAKKPVKVTLGGCGG